MKGNSFHHCTGRKTTLVFLPVELCVQLFAGSKTVSVEGLSGFQGRKPRPRDHKGRARRCSIPKAPFVSPKEM